MNDKEFYSLTKQQLKHTFSETFDEAFIYKTYFISICFVKTIFNFFHNSHFNISMSFFLIFFSVGLILFSNFSLNAIKLDNLEIVSIIKLFLFFFLFKTNSISEQIPNSPGESSTIRKLSD